MVGFKAKTRASAYFTKLGWRRGCVFVGAWGVLEGWECIGRRERRETTPSYHICYIKFISS